MKLIFLDVDGVLNCGETKETINGWLFVDNEKIEQLKRIVDATGAKIVLSSTWRQGYYGITQRNPGDTSDWGVEEYEALAERCGQYGLTFFGFTRWPMIADRELEIIDWMNSWDGEKIESYVILDDIPFFTELIDHFVQTDFADGLTPELADKAIEILGGEQ